MKIDRYGQQIYSEEDICNLYLTNPDIKITDIIVDKKIQIHDIIENFFLPNLIQYTDLNNISLKEFDLMLQNNYFISNKYKDFDIAKYVLSLCKTDEELQRVGTELLMFQERNMFPFLIYLKYLVDVLRENNIVWGVGRGSSVASYVLFLLGIHKINSIFYDLDIKEFLK